MKEIQEDLDKAVKVIKIEITPQEQEQLTGELSGFLQWLEPLLAVDTVGVDQVLISHGAVNVTRKDEIHSTEPTDLQKAAPNFEEGFYQVPTIIE